MVVTGMITMIVSLLISIVSAYCTVVGMGKVFASAAMVTMFIASVIELGRVVLIYDLHHYWNELKLFQKIPGVCMLLISITLSAMGIFGFMSNAHSQRTQEIIPIEMQIKEKQQQINILNDAIEVNNQQLKQFDGKAFDKYTEMGYVTKAVNLQKEQQKVTNELYNDNRLKQQDITKLNQEILALKLDAEKKAPTLAHIKYYAKLFNVDNDTAIIIFIVMIMLVFDTLAMYLMITADWINKRGKREETLEKKEALIRRFDDQRLSDNLTKLEKIVENEHNPIVQETIDYEKLAKIVDNNHIKDDVEQIVKNNLTTTLNDIERMNKDLNNDINNRFDRLEVNDKSHEYTHLLTKILDKVENNDNEELCAKLDKISERISQNKIDKYDEDGVLLSKITTSIDNNEDVINSDRFLSMIDENPKILDKLKRLYKRVPSVLEKLNNL